MGEEPIADARAVELIASGDYRQALEVVVGAYQHKIIRFCSSRLRFVGMEENSRDVAQEIFIAVYRGMPGFRMESSLCTWIYSIARNQCFKALRGHQRHENLPPDYENRPSDNPEKDLFELVTAALRKLDKKSRSLLLMRYETGLSIEQIAVIEGISIRTVLRRLKNALQILRKEVLKDEQ